jgi:ion channel-forming bestrophin family protein
MSRLIWFHVPPLVSQKTAAEIASGKLERSREEQLRVMEEKRHALDLIEGYIYFFFILIPGADNSFRAGLQ